MNTKVNEGKLISGDEAKKAWANGETVEFHYADTIWSELPSCAQLSIFDDEEIKFRVKPKTILINGIEVPCCGENYQYGDAMYILNSLELREYSLVVLDVVDEIPAYWWRTEEEIKQVVAALCQVFGGSHDN